MDENTFFRQATLRICENLEIKDALITSLLFLREVIPLDKISLQVYDHGFGSMRAIAAATPTWAGELDLLIPLSEEAREVAQGTTLDESQDVVIFEDPQENVVSREMLAFFKVPCTSLMVLVLKFNGKSWATWRL